MKKVEKHAVWISGSSRTTCRNCRYAGTSDTVEDYLHKRGIDKAYCKKMVVELLEKKGEAKREDSDGLLRKKLSNAITEDQKTNFMRNPL